MANRSKAPLRRIVDTLVTDDGLRFEVLECGHRQPQRQDMIGPTNAYRRRCRRCAKKGGDHG